MSKLTGFFPGMGYTAEKLLLHYSRRIAAGADCLTGILHLKLDPPKKWY